MFASSILDRRRRLNKAQKLSVAGVSALGAAALAFSLVPGGSDAETEPQAVSAAPVTLSSTGTAQSKALQSSVIEKNSTAEQLVRAADLAKAKAAAQSKAASAVKAEKKAPSKAKAGTKKRSAQAASRSVSRPALYSNNLDGWIREALDIMKAKGIPGSYEGLHRNIVRESSGNPKAINNWDVNAQNGIPSKGLLQVIPPTFNAFHVKGTPKNIYDPVANITAAANYAAGKYGSIDNVNSAY
ncbi:transglycosylase SLT domain-containing protein [Streptomyces sp. DT171]|uniref:transglycosylase SLT domain-containing protein n=1 Tax=Streptomyces sp. DT171 TaxID=3416524 RepID=UPI003CF70989